MKKYKGVHKNNQVSVFMLSTNEIIGVVVYKETQILLTPVILIMATDCWIVGYGIQDMIDQISFSVSVRYKQHISL